MSNKKQNFVELGLCNFLNSINKDIVETVYEQTDNGEYVHVLMKNGASYKIDITADSLMAICCDVFKFMIHK